ncbi:predicted protein [Sclerotinia sclerotiorum 1980 UF-70]|uniref:Uncharacterized protein n=1 Tax=Sclerotinia sclerotiorum (strain ATCC 18683 / 1980 / Ss-1) TaxID=665079 RepID=A7EZV2_SCLS1|nr:predicted protein [Sclerotinia sclerotiorum 1980 UF-70]EDN94994.1 predicted protein [Sclerotinia sclerotiorum 1980 UF-70]
MNVLVLSACFNDDNECFILEEDSLLISETVVKVKSYPLEEEGYPLPPGMVGKHHFTIEVSTP